MKINLDEKATKELQRLGSRHEKTEAEIVQLALSLFKVFSEGEDKGCVFEIVYPNGTRVQLSVEG